MSLRLNVMPLCEIRVVNSFRVTARIEMTGRFPVMARGVFVVLRRFVVAFGGWFGHRALVSDSRPLGRRRVFCAPVAPARGPTQHRRPLRSSL
jgi:hypothetical protein